MKEVTSEKCNCWVEHFYNIFVLTPTVFSNHAQKWGQICRKSVQLDRVTLFRSHFFQNWYFRKTQFLLSNSMDFKCQLKFRMKYPGYSSSYCFHVTSPDSAVKEETWTFSTVTKVVFLFIWIFQFRSILEPVGKENLILKDSFWLVQRFPFKSSPPKSPEKCVKVETKALWVHINSGEISLFWCEISGFCLLLFSQIERT